MDLSAARLTRHDVLVGLLCALAGFTTGSLVVRVHDAKAAKARKEDQSYQDKPNDGESCMSCRHFLPTGQDRGVCAVVEGEVTFNGWCVAYTPRFLTQLREKPRHEVETA
jgi:hypothetical protein